MEAFMSYLNICVVTVRLGKKTNFFFALYEDLCELPFFCVYFTFSCAKNGDANYMPFLKSFITSSFSVLSKWNYFDGSGRLRMTSHRGGSLSDVGRDA
jgi:hypothetical protein